MFDGNMLIEIPAHWEIRDTFDEFWEFSSADMEDKDEPGKENSVKPFMDFPRYPLFAVDERPARWETRETIDEFGKLFRSADMEDKYVSGVAIRWALKKVTVTVDETRMKKFPGLTTYSKEKSSDLQGSEGQLSIRNTSEKTQSLPFGISLSSAFAPRMKAITVHMGEWSESKMKSKMKMRQRRLFSADKMYHGENKGKWKNFPCFLEDENALQDQESPSDDNCEDKLEILKEENEELDKEMNEILQQCILCLNEMHTQRPTQKRQRATI